MGSWDSRRKQIARASSTRREELDHKGVSGPESVGKLARLLVLDAGKWVSEVLAEPNGCEGMKATAREGDGICLQCVSDLVA